ncbi:MAG: ribonuclease [Bryobacterales bacterium]|nr:ribonuclease [Bryobacterales bacterium]
MVAPAEKPTLCEPARKPHSAIWQTLGFLFQTEVHVYSFAVAVNVLLTFFPFLACMVILCQYVLHWRPAVQVIIHAVNDYFPTGFGVDFKGYLIQSANSRKFSWISVFLLLFTANGIFVPLEVALNRIWHVKQNRSLLRNQAVSLGLIFACGMLVLTSVCITTLNVQFLTQRFGVSHLGAVTQMVIFKLTALPISMLMIFLVYWLLPNARIPVKRLIPASVAVGALLEVSKYVNILTWPWLQAKLRNEVPPFVQSTSIVLWAFIATLIILAGAEASARASVSVAEDSLEESSRKLSAA